MSAVAVEHPERRDERILILTPVGRDAYLTRTILRGAGVHCDVCTDVRDFASRIREGAGAGLLSEEAIFGDRYQDLIQVANDQPAWSDFPFIVVAGGGASTEQTVEVVRVAKLLGNVTILERPVRLSTLVRAVESALRARHRQYEIRDYLVERERREEAYVQAQKLESLGVMAGGLAHDFNNLLTGVLGNASLAIEALHPTHSCRPFLQNVVSGCERAADLTKQMLAFAGKGAFVIQPINLSRLVRDINQLIHTLIPKKVQLRLELENDLPYVMGDASQLQQIIMNLVINGAEAIEGNGVVTVRTSRCPVKDTFGYNVTSPKFVPGDYVCLEVCDTGVGMDPQTQMKIFDPFFTTKFTGRGLGLSAVSGIVRNAGGALKVTSKAGDGCALTVLLPAAKHVELAPRPETPKQTDVRGSGMILVVDDENDVLRLARMVLQRAGYTVLTAIDGEEGVAMFIEHADQIKLVLLDLTMPKLSGREVYDRIREIRPEVKVVLSSGYNEEESRREFEVNNLAGFLQKPYAARTLAEKVKVVLSER